MSGPQSPCQGCPNRSLGCHGKCKRYQAYETNRKKYNEKIHAERCSEVTGYKREGAAQAQAREHRKGHKKQR